MPISGTSDQTDLSPLAEKMAGEPRPTNPPPPPEPGIGRHYSSTPPGDIPPSGHSPGRRALADLLMLSLTVLAVLVPAAYAAMCRSI
jgi:hypothetical protein